VKWRAELPAILGAGYDVVIVQYGNADVHPRLPWRVQEAIRKVTGVKLRDTWFQVPPRFGPKFLMKFPLQMLKRVLVWVLGSESFTSTGRMLEFFQDVRARLPEGTRLIIVPLFGVRRWLYGTSHNEAVAALNARLRECFGDAVLTVPASPEYVTDGFHWTETFHRRLADALSERIPSHEPTRVGMAHGPA